MKDGETKSAKVALAASVSVIEISLDNTRWYDQLKDFPANRLPISHRRKRPLMMVYPSVMFPDAKSYILDKQY
ncbi:hypothetical protein [Paraburkholderia sp. DGU8]|uniref:hypothetical protein n=1 Tax=Paraburkholderia sp. DGU8 TaxID=3161997 RepID=UPI00346766EE